MSGSLWLKSLSATDPGLRRRRMEVRIREKARGLTQAEARAHLESFVGRVDRLHDLSIAWIGCWSQSLDDHIKRAIYARTRKP